MLTQYLQPHRSRFTVPEFLTERLASLLLEEVQTPEAIQRGIHRLRQLHRTPGTGGVVVPYDDLSLPFLYKYFGSNFASVYLTLVRAWPPEAQKPRFLCDLGCGSGASAAAFALFVNSLCTELHPLQIVMYDRSRAQCQYAHRIMEGVKAHCDRLELEYQILCEDITSEPPKEFLQGLGPHWVLCSFVLSEIGLFEARRVVETANTLLGRARPHDTMLIVEQERSFLTKLMEEETNAVAVQPLYRDASCHVSGLEKLEIFDTVERPKKIITPNAICFRAR